MKNKKPAIILASALCFGVLSEALDIPGFPQIVFDPIQKGNMLQALAHDLKMIAVLAQQAEMMQNNLRYFSSSVKYRFQGVSQPFYHPTVGNIFGETAQFANIAAGGLGTAAKAQQVWKQAGTPLDPSVLYSHLDMKSPNLVRLANVEITDGLASNALQTVSNVRMQQPMNEAAIAAINKDCSADGNNWAAMQLNCVVAGGMLNAQTGQTTNALLTALADLNTAAVKRQRDEDVERINLQSKITNYQATETTDIKSSANTLQYGRPF